MRNLSTVVASLKVVAAALVYHYVRRTFMYSVWIAFGALRLSHKTAKNREKPYKRYKAFTVYTVYSVFYGFSRFWVCLGPDPSL